MGRIELPLALGLGRALGWVWYYLIPIRRRVALVKAQAAALRIAMRVPVDSERRLDSFEALRVKVKGVVSGGQVLSEEARGKDFALTLEVPLSGVKGLQAEVRSRQRRHQAGRSTADD